MNTQQATYASAEVRGRLRQWKRSLATKYRVIEQLVEDTTRDIDAFMHRGSRVGRQRAFAKIAGFVAPSGATLEGVRLDGHPVAVWSILRPRISVVVVPDDPSLAQDCITVNYVIVGGPHVGAAHGLWTVEIPDHALGRLLDRTTSDPAACITEAHHAALRLRFQDVIEADGTARTEQFLLPAGPGAFVCSIFVARDCSIGLQAQMHVRAHTWLSADMLRDDQTPIIDDGAPGERLGDNWMLPAPLRLSVPDEYGVTHLAWWAPGLPETLAAPRGTA